MQPVRFYSPGWMLGLPFGGFCAYLAYVVSQSTDVRQFAAFVPAVAAGLSLGVALGYGAVRVFPVEVSSKGIRCYDEIGHYSLMAWEEIAFVQVQSILGFRYIYLYRAHGAEHQTIPLYLSRMHDFVWTVRRYAPSGNPLRDFLQHLFGDPTTRNPKRI